MSMFKPIFLLVSGIGAGLAGKALSPKPLPTLSLILVAGSIAALTANASAARNADGRTAAVEPASVDRRTVRISSQREGEMTRFYVHNAELCPVTVTFDLALKHLKSTVDFPHTAVFPPGEVTEAFTVEPDGSGGAWEYSYTNHYKLGSCRVGHDDSVVYQLPYAPGRRHKVTQAANGKFSHKGSNKYAVDWKMPVGTPVHAARGGLVIKAKQDSNRGGPNMSFDKYNNFVLIEHEDGTLGHYCHLKQGSVRVQPGQRVQTGDLLALSGNTGFSSGPHLHFCVFRTKDGRERESVPVRFRTAEMDEVTLVSGRQYEAAAVRTASAAGVAAPAPAAGSAGSDAAGSGAARAL